MATVEHRKNSYRIIFYFRNRRFSAAIKTDNRREADEIAASVERTIRHIYQGVVTVPADADFATFVVSGGKQPGRVEPLKSKPSFTLGEIQDRYFAVHEMGSLEANSLYTIKIHLRHIVKSLNASFPIQELTQSHLQDHVQRRSKSKGLYGRPIKPATLRKEIASFRAVWNWAVAAGMITGAFPNKGLVFPKDREKPPFQTWAEIVRQIERGGLSGAEVRELWDNLFLTAIEVEELLDFVEKNALHRFIYAMVVFAARTGARRSELLRVRVADVDFESGFALIREKKRDKKKETMRRVPITPRLEQALRDWLAEHPGGPVLFAYADRSAHSRKKDQPAVPLTRDEVSDHFKRTLAGSKWAVLRGWHVLRHSFISNCAAAGVDQRMTDSWSGHTTEEMRKRYLHLMPTQEREALRSVFVQ